MPGAHTFYLVRHAIAEERGPTWPDDTKRPLTRDGEKKMRRIVDGLLTLNVAVDVVLTSPLVRAAETARIVAKGLEPRPRIVELPALAPGHSVDDVIAALEPHRKARLMALVGHEPDLGTLGAWLIGASQPIPFKKGGVARIEIPAWPPSRNGHLVWLATPAMLRRLA